MGAAASIRKSFSRDSREESPPIVAEGKSSKETSSKGVAPEIAESKNHVLDDLLSPADSQIDDVRFFDFFVFFYSYKYLRIIIVLSKRSLRWAEGPVDDHKW